MTNDGTSNDVTALMRAANHLRFEDPSEAHRIYLSAVEASRKPGLRRELIHALKGLGQIERDLKRGNAASPLYEEAVALCREEGDALLLAHTIRHLGDIHQDAHRDDLAAGCRCEIFSG